MTPPQILGKNFPASVTFSNDGGTLVTPAQNSTVRVQAGIAGTIEVILSRNPSPITFEDGSQRKSQSKVFVQGQVQTYTFPWGFKVSPAQPHRVDTTIDIAAQYTNDLPTGDQARILLNYPAMATTEAVAASAAVAAGAVAAAVRRRAKKKTAARKAAVKKAGAKKIAAKKAGAGGRKRGAAAKRSAAKRTKPAKKTSRKSIARRK